MSNNVSNFTNMSSMTEYFTIADGVSDGYLVYTLIVVVWIALFASSITFGRSKALTFSSFVTGILLLMLNIGGHVDYWLIIADMILFSAGLLMLIFTKRET